MFSLEKPIYKHKSYHIYLKLTQFKKRACNNYNTHNTLPISLNHTVILEYFNIKE